jgi:alpha-mannosidase
MKKLLPFILFLQLVLFPQTNVDKITKQLEELGTFSFNDWKISDNLSSNIKFDGNPYDINFDDSKWKTIGLNEISRFDSCWLRKEIVLPKTFLGLPVEGKVNLLVSVDDFGYMWINGESKGYFPWDGEFTLTENAKPGQKFLFAIKAINTGGPLRIIRAQLDVETSKPLREKISDFNLSIQTGQKLLSFDTYQTNARVKVDPGIDQSTLDKSEKEKLNQLLQDACLQVDIDALKNGEVSKFEKSLDDVRQKLTPVKEFAKKFTLFFDSNAHIDAAWLWRKKESVEVCRNTFSSVFNIMNVRPGFTYTQSATQYYKWIENFYPDIFNDIKVKVKEGRWEIIGGMWIEPDCNIPSGVSWMRQLLYAKNYFYKKFGLDIKIGWNPDSFGYNWNMPMFYKNSGIDAFITQKIGWNDTNVFPYRVFWWESPDGSKILSYFPFDYVNTITQSYQLVDWLRQFEANTGFRNMLVLFGIGDHGGGPSIDMIDRIEHLKTLDIYPNIKYGTATEYLDWMKSQDLKNIPTWKDELYLEYHQGTLTTQSQIKKYNRECETLLTNAEKFSSLSKLFGVNYDDVNINAAWEIVMFNQFHDILPGSSIREVYVDAKEDYSEAKKIGDFVLKNSLDEINKKINTSEIENGRPLVVYNPLAWDRTDVVKFNLPEGDLNEYSISDLDGNEIPSQIIHTSRFTNQIIFIAGSVPSLGYKTYLIKKEKSRDNNPKFNASLNKIENEYFIVNIDTSTGWVKSIYDKKNNKEILSSEGNKLQLLEDKPTAWDAWNLGLTGVEYPSHFVNAEVTENGPIRTVVRLTRDYLKPGVVKDFPTANFPSSFFTQDIILYNELDRIDFKTDIDWWESRTMLKVAFPVSVSDTLATYEIPYGTISRSTQRKTSWEKAKYEVAALQWGDLSNDNYGISLLNNSKYGYDIKDNVMRLSLLRSPKWPDPTADMGTHSIEYSLFPHKGNWKEANTVRRGYEFNQPLIAVLTDIHDGELPTQNSFIQVSGDGIILTTLKKALNSDDWIIQWYESEGKDGDAIITLPKVPKKVFETDFIEKEEKEIPFENNVIKIRTPKSSVKTIKVVF